MSMLDREDLRNCEQIEESVEEMEIFEGLHQIQQYPR